MTNSIRPVAVASLLVTGEAQMTPSETLPSGCDAPNAVAAVSPRERKPDLSQGRLQVVGDGMVGRFDDVKEGDLYGRKDRRSFVANTDTKNRASTGVRAPVVARKPGNAGGNEPHGADPPSRAVGGHEGRTGRSEGVQEGGDAMTKRTKDKPATVPFRAKQAGESRPRWWWVEPSVWTERMLTALEQGVKGGVWFSLIDKVYSEGNLQAAFEAVAANDGAAGVDHVTIEQFAARLPENLEHLHASLQAETYVPQAVRRVWIPKPGTNQQRPLGIPTVSS